LQQFLLPKLNPSHEYEVRPRKDHRGVDLISDVLPFGRLTAFSPNFNESHAMTAIEIKPPLGLESFWSARCRARFPRETSGDQLCAEPRKLSLWRDSYLDSRGVADFQREVITCELGSLRCCAAALSVAGDSDRPFNRLSSRAFCN